MHSDVSVVIPAYNGAAYIGQALDSVFAQTRPAREVVVVDDASADDTAARVVERAKAAPVPVRLLRLRENSGGPARPINAGVAAAAGEFVAVLDQDDVFLPNKLRDQAAALTRHPDAGFAFSLAGALEAPGEPVQPPALVNELCAASAGEGNWRLIPGDQALRLLMRYGTYVLGFPGFLFRRRDWERRGGCDESFRICVDYEFLCWLSARGAAVFGPQVHYLRRQHGANLTRERKATYLEDARVKARTLSRHRWLLREPSPYVPTREELECWGYWLRQEGHHRDALRAYFLRAYTWGLDVGTVLSALKVLAHGVVHRCRRLLKK